MREQDKVTGPVDIRTTATWPMHERRGLASNSLNLETCNFSKPRRQRPQHTFVSFYAWVV